MLRIIRGSILHASPSSSSKEAQHSKHEQDTVSLLTVEQELLEIKRSFEQAQALMQRNQQSVGVSRSQLIQQIADLEREQSDPTFWDDGNANRATAVHQQLSHATALLSRLDDWKAWHGDAAAALEMLQDDNDINNDNMMRMDPQEQQMLLTELDQAVQKLLKDNQQAELEWLLSGPYDDSDARLYITAGAGGTEANDWVDMLSRMYIRYCNNNSHNNLRCTTVDTVAGDQVGYKSVELLVQ